MFVLTTGDSPIDQGVWCLVEDSIGCHSGTGVQHNIKSTHKETYGTGNSDEYTVMNVPRSHRRGVHSSTPPPFHPPQQNAHWCIHPHILPHVVERESDSTGKNFQFNKTLTLKYTPILA